MNLQLPQASNMKPERLFQHEQTSNIQDASEFIRDKYKDGSSKLSTPINFCQNYTRCGARRGSKWKCNSWVIRREIFQISHKSLALLTITKWKGKQEASTLLQRVQHQHATAIFQHILKQYVQICCKFMWVPVRNRLMGYQSVFFFFLILYSSQ